MRPAVGEKSIRQNIRETLMRRIASGQYAYGEKLPSMREFALEFHVGHSTVKRVFADLAESGVIASSQGRCSHVAVAPLQQDRAAQRFVFLCRHEPFDAEYREAPWGWLVGQSVTRYLMTRQMPVVTISPEMLEDAATMATAAGIVYIDPSNVRMDLREKIRNSGKPCVFITSYHAETDSGENVIALDFEKVMTKSAFYFLSHSVRYCAIFTESFCREKLAFGTPENRFEAFCRTLAENGMTENEVEFWFFDSFAAPLTAAQREKLQTLPRPFGVIASSDLMAKALLQEMERWKLVAKQDYYVIGGMGLAEAADWPVALSNFTMPFERIGEAAGAQLLQKIEEPLPTPEATPLMRFAPSLAIRGS